VTDKPAQKWFLDAAVYELLAAQAKRKEEASS
jgi:hypothetical protein